MKTWTCEVCGYLHTGAEPPAECPVCGAGKEQFALTSNPPTQAKTQENLLNAFAGESQANRKYTVFAQKAASEGLDNIAKLFQAAAEAEAIHAGKLLAAAGKAGSTAENLQAAAKGERYEFEEMYPGFIKDAEAEGEKKAAKLMDMTMEAEKAHEALYQEALQALSQGQDLPEEELYLCPVCGWVGRKADHCPICKSPKLKQC